MFPPTQNRPPVLETKAGITDERTAEYGELILGIVKHTYSQPEEKKQFRKWISGFISGYLQKRLSKNQAENIKQMFKPGHLSVFDQIIANTIKNFEVKGKYSVQRGQGDSYLEVNNPYIESNLWKKKDIDNQKVQICDKEYFTFTPSTTNPSKTLLEASKFYDALFLSYSRIQNLAKINGWSVSMKFKSDLLDLVDDLDSAVFYVSDEKAGNILRKIVVQEMEKLGLKSERFGRPESGFDIKFPDGKTFSHRQLISQAVSKVIDDDYHGERKIPSMSPVDFGKGIKERVEKSGNLTPEQILKVI